MNWGWYFLIGVIVYPFLKLLVRAINREIIEYRKKKILKLVNIEFPDHSKITYISLDTSDRRAMAKIERHLREEFDIPEERGRDRDRTGNLRRKAPRDRQDASR